MESKIVLLSLFSRLTHATNRPSPKSYPLDKAIKLVELLKQEGYFTIQIGMDLESDIKADDRKNGLQIKNIVELLKQSCFFISCDNMLHHMADFYGKRGIVLFSKSNPKVFGHESNINLLKDEKFLRSSRQQFEYWENTAYIENAFVSPEIILKEIRANF